MYGSDSERRFSEGFEKCASSELELSKFSLKNILSSWFWTCKIRENLMCCVLKCLSRRQLDLALGGGQIQSMESLGSTDTSWEWWLTLVGKDFKTVL